MQKNISDLDLSNEVDILYAIKNFAKYPDEITPLLKDLKINDFSFGTFCYGIIESLCLFELSECHIDKEINELLDYSLKRDENPTEESTNVAPVENPVSAGTEDKLDSLESPQETNEQTVDSKTDISNSELKSQAQEKYFHIKRLDILIKPFIGLCNKQIVDLVFYVYKKTGISHFDLLFREFTEPSQRIELHLLVAKGLKSRLFDMSDVKEVLEEAAHSGPVVGEESNSADYTKVDYGVNDFESMFSDKEDDKEDSSNLSSSNGPIIPLPFEDENKKEDNNSTTLESKPFRYIFNVDYHLAEAKKLLLDLKFDYKASEFHVDKLTSFLTIKYDPKIFSRLLAYEDTHHFMVYLHRLPTAPYFFYCDYDFVRHEGQIPTPRIDPFELKQHLPPVPEYKMNCRLLKSYLESVDFSLQLGSYGDRMYLLNLKRFRSCFKTYQSVGFFKIFVEFMENKRKPLEKEVKATILMDLDMYLDAFYNESTDFDTYTTPKPESNRDEHLEVWNLGKPKDDIEGAPEYNMHGSFQRIQSFYLDHDFFLKQDARIAKHLLVQYYKQSEADKVNRIDYLNTLLLELSNDPENKVYVLRSIEKLYNLMHIDCKKPGEDEERRKTNTAVFELICTHLKNFPERPWRYKKMFIQKAIAFDKLGVTKEWLKETFSKDKIFYIRKMAQDL